MSFGGYLHKAIDVDQIQSLDSVSFTWLGSVFWLMSAYRYFCESVRLNYHTPHNLIGTSFGFTSFINLGGFTVRDLNIFFYRILTRLCQKIMYLDFASGTVSDLSVSMTLCALLYRSRTGFHRYAVWYIV